jgi:hypothetical protein
MRKAGCCCCCHLQTWEGLLVTWQVLISPFMNEGQEENTLIHTVRNPWWPTTTTSNLSEPEEMAIPPRSTVSIRSVQGLI